MYNKYFLVKTVVISCSVIAMSACIQQPVKSSLVMEQEHKQDKIPPLTVSAGPQEEFNLALDLAGLEIEQQRYDRAEALLQKLRKIQRDDIRVYRMLAKVYEAQSKSKMAFLAWLEVNDFVDKQVDDESELARLALINQRFHMAEVIYQSWLEAPEINRQVSALNNLGFAALLQNKYPQAKDFFWQALEKDPLNNKALSNLQLVNTLME